jgi:hypothetical protein
LPPKENTLRNALSFVAVIALSIVARAPAAAQDYSFQTAVTAEATQATPSQQAPPAAVDPDTQKAIDAAVAAAVTKALSGKWYERFTIRGYAQFRFSEVFTETGPPLEVYSDRSVQPAETLILRRGRFVFSGDVSSHLYVYIQSDFNASTGATDLSLQARDYYADVSFDKQKEFRVRLGQSKVPYGWVNMQSSGNRVPFERADAINTAVEGERDYGAFLMWAPTEARQRFREIVSQGLKGSGDYGVITGGVYAGQGPNRPDLNGRVHGLARVAYPFETAGGQFFELGAQAYYGQFVVTTQAITVGGVTITPVMDNRLGPIDKRIAFTAIWYPQPLGFEAEWNFGRGPELSSDFTLINSQPLEGGYAQINFRHRFANSAAVLYPFARWNYFDGARKFARNAPPMRVNELEIGAEWSPWPELELTLVYAHSFRRTRTNSFPYDITRDAGRIGFQVQWNY